MRGEPWRTGPCTPPQHEQRPLSTVAGLRGTHLASPPSGESVLPRSVPGSASVHPIMARRVVRPEGIRSLRDRHYLANLNLQCMEAFAVVSQALLDAFLVLLSQQD